MEYNFRIDVDGCGSIWCQDVTGLNVSTPSGSPARPRLPGLTKYGNITLRRGMTASDEVLGWIQSCAAGKIARKRATITLMGEDGSDTATWQIKDAWALKYSFSEIAGEAPETAIETLEIGYTA
ncbi:MAG TPA: phage tail protein [Anaerolineaceae bacterium]